MPRANTVRRSRPDTTSLSEEEILRNYDYQGNASRMGNFTVTMLADSFLTVTKLLTTTGNESLTASDEELSQFLRDVMPTAITMQLNHTYHEWHRGENLELNRHVAEVEKRPDCLFHSIHELCQKWFKLLMRTSFVAEIRLLMNAEVIIITSFGQSIVDAIFRHNRLIGSHLIVATGPCRPGGCPPSLYDPAVNPFQYKAGSASLVASLTGVSEMLPTPLNVT